MEDLHKFALHGGDVYVSVIIQSFNSGFWWQHESSLSCPDVVDSSQSERQKSECLLDRERERLELE